tara:strand:+ start:51 stop:224 length:174 start_codon:yes stop_codon:yes gene_type:complete
MMMMMMMGGVFFLLFCSFFLFVFCVLFVEKASLTTEWRGRRRKIILKEFFSFLSFEE